MSNGTFDFNAFVQESKDVLVNPKAYFSTMKTSGGLTEPIIKALIYGVVAGIISFILGMLHLTVSVGGLFGGMAGAGMLFARIFGAIIGLFIGAVILLVISSICKGSTDFEANARVVAATMVILPISALFSFLVFVNVYLGVIVSICISAFSLWLLYHGLVEALKAKPETAKIVMYVLVALIVVFSLVGIGAQRKAKQMMNEFNSSEFKEMMEQQK